MIDKTYQPGEVEARIAQAWEAAQAFRAGRPDRARAEPYCIVIPPPNVTGSLHMGHALNNTLQDVLCRFQRMRGRDVLWQPGTDHAGIATQMVVERQLLERQEPGRRIMGREKFLARVWAWKAESGDIIVNQLKRLGASCDWSRLRFTMDEGLSRAVIKVFVELYREGLIYKDKRLVNWDPKLLTAISDLEVQQIEHRGSFKWSRDSGEPLDALALGKILSRDPNGHLYYIHYPIEGSAFDPNNPSTFITVATTRPETMLGDTGIAVHPDDERYKHLRGKRAILPLVGRLIRIVEDEYSDPEKGTGAVKLTPAHDFNDFEVGKPHALSIINIFDEQARLLPKFEVVTVTGTGQSRIYHLRATGIGDPQAEVGYDDLPEGFAGLDRFAARKRIVERLDAAGLIEKVEPHTHMVPHGDRSGVVLEPRLTEQWYVNAKKLAEPAIAAVRAGRTKFIPKNWEKTYFDWMENIQPWNISRQLWWGHQIPVWYGPTVDEQGFAVEGSYKEFVAETEQAALAEAKLYYGPDVEVAVDKNPVFQASIDSFCRRKVEQVGIGRDPDVLDTWFSSALWPFSTLGWPDETPELKRFYPTSALVTGFDIIFFWVARMMMMGLHFMREVPFRDVYIHALVRDERGAKMSKSKGNVIDPLAIIDDYGADALRFTLAAMAAQGRDIKLSAGRVEGSRNFATKLWNAARFAEMNACVTVPGFDPKSAKEILNRWIAHETAKAAREVTQAIKDYKFNDAAGALYRFVWNIYCDWYLELAKPLLTGPDGAAKDETQAMVAWARDEILKLLHPFMPFITEELWAVTAPRGTAADSFPSPLVGEGREGGTGSERYQLLALAPWPAHAGLDDDKAEAEIGWLIDLVNAIRSLRAEMNIPSATQLPLVLAGASAESKMRAKRWQDFLQRLARVSHIDFADAAPAGAVQLVVRGEIAALPLKGVIDLAAERARLQKEMAKADSDIARVDAKLLNADFLARAPEDVVDGEREKREEAAARREKILQALERLKGAA